jgi:hypothetical protein
MYLSNGVEVLLPSHEAGDYLNLPVASAGEIEQGAFMYWDTSSNTVKKFAPADASANEPLQNLIIGILSAGKKVGDTEAVVMVKGTVLMDATDTTLGLDAVVVYTPTTGKYSAYEGTAYNTATNPDITLANSFLLFAVNAAEGGKAKLTFDGQARLAAST